MADFNNWCTGTYISRSFSGISFSIPTFWCHTKSYPGVSWLASSKFIGHPRVTVARQLDWALFVLGLILAKSTFLAARRKVANHSPRTPRGKQTSSTDIWSGGFPFLSNTFTHLHRGHFRYACTWRFGLLPDRVLK
jgi:hypothetical protein